MQPLGEISALGGLLWPRWRTLLNAPRSRDGRSLLRLLFFAGLGAAFMLTGFLGAFWLFGKFLQVEFLAELLIRRVLGMVLLFFTGLLVFSNVISAFSTFFLADDLDLLISSPVPVGRLYLARLFDTWLQSSWMILVFALPIIAGCGPVLGAPWWFYLALPLLLLPLTVVCSAVGSGVTLILARLLPARRTQHVLMVLALLAFLVVYLAFRLSEPERFLDPEGFDNLVALIGSLRGASIPYSPSDWTLQALFGVVRGEWGEVTLPALALLTAAPAACTLGAWLAKGTYFTSFSLSQEGRNASQRKARTHSRLPNRFLRSPTSALMARDTRMFFRTTGQWIQLLLIGALVVVYVFNFKHFRTLQATGIIGSAGLFFLNVALGGFVVTTLSVRFLYPAVSLEGRAWWSVRVAPISPRTLLRAKTRWGFWPLLFIAEVLAVASTLLLGLAMPWMLAAAAVALVTTYALTGLAVGLGATDPRFYEDNPAKIAGSVGGVIFMLLGMTYLIIVVALLIVPMVSLRDFLEIGFAPRHARLWICAALVGVALLLSLVAHHVPMRMGARVLERRED